LNRAIITDHQKIKANPLTRQLKQKQVFFVLENKSTE
jgi:hypothetical protein